LKPERGAGKHYYALPDGTRLLEFEIVEVLGHGGFGITYLATDTHLEEPVAIKEYLPNELAVRTSDATVQPKSEDDAKDFAAGRSDFLEEARRLARFRHPNILEVRRFFELNGTGYIVSRYEDGETLGRRLERAPMEEAELREILSGLLAGLDVVHQRAMLHRDLKPGNVILSSDGTPVLIDFGAARDFNGRHSRSVTAIVARGYSPPEQYGIGGQYGPWTDLYALGAIAYRCVTGAAPVDSLARLRKDPLIPAIEAGAGKYDPGLLRTIDWMLKINESARPGSVAQVQAALLLPSGSVPVSASPGGKTASSFKVLSGAKGSALIILDPSVPGEVIEASLEVSPPGSFLGPGNSGWSSTPSELRFEKADGAGGQTGFRVPAEIVRRIPAGATVTLSSRDGLIEATASWPRVRASVPAWIRPTAAAAVLIAGAVAYSAWQAGRERERLALGEFEACLTRTPCQASACTGDLGERLASIGVEKRQAAVTAAERSCYGTAVACAEDNSSPDRVCEIEGCFGGYLQGYPTGASWSEASAKITAAKASCSDLTSRKAADEQKKREHAAAEDKRKRDDAEAEAKRQQDAQAAREADLQRQLEDAQRRAAQAEADARTARQVAEQREAEERARRAQEAEAQRQRDEAALTTQPEEPSAPAETQPQPGPSLWEHDGSTLRLVAEGSHRQFIYEYPRALMADQGVVQGTVLFDGRRSGYTYSGTAYRYLRGCGSIAYEVWGTISADNRSVTLHGRAPHRNRSCEVAGYTDDELVFTFTGQ
jgi:serine/threonine protein kinase